MRTISRHKANPGYRRHHTRSSSLRSSSSKSGQALAEFVIGLIAVLTLAACLRVGSYMITAHSDAMAKARSEAAESASLGVDTLSDAKYIHEVTDGKDQRQYTKDDKFTTAGGSEFNSIILGRTVSAQSDWDVLDQAPNNRISKLNGNMNPSTAFGLVVGSDKKTVPIDQVPAVRFFYNAKTMEVECNVWMTQINGLY